MEIFIANLNANIEEELLLKLFEAFGTVTKTVLVRDKETRKSKGFGFVTMDNAIEAQRAIDELDGRELGGKVLSVKESTPRDSKETTRKQEDAPSDSFRQENKTKKLQEDFIDTKDDDFEERKEEPIKLVNETKYTKTTTDDGFVKISFNK
jgi:RNA recognition motif-containing protein